MQTIYQGYEFYNGKFAGIKKGKQYEKQYDEKNNGGGTCGCFGSAGADGGGSG